MAVVKIRQERPSSVQKALYALEMLMKLEGPFHELAEDGVAEQEAHGMQMVQAGLVRRAYQALKDGES